VAAGLPEQEIADKLFLTQAAAKALANRAMAKLGTRPAST
jgi:DNA-binding CsgD family transcriptional regulator